MNLAALLKELRAETLRLLRGSRCALEKARSTTKDTGAGVLNGKPVDPRGTQYGLVG